MVVVAKVNKKIKAHLSFQVSLSSDDPSVFATSLTDEMRLSGDMGLSHGEMARATLAAVDAAFISPPEVSRIKYPPRRIQCLIFFQ